MVYAHGLGPCSRKGLRVRISPKAPKSMNIVIYIVCALMIVAGFAGTVLPMLPGVPLVFLGTAILAFYTKFTVISKLTLVIFLVLTIVSLLIDYLSGIIGAKYSGASLWGTIGAIIGALVGIMCFGLLGLIFGPAIFVLVFEYLSEKSLKKSTRSASYTLLSTILGMILNGTIALAMLVIFVIAIIV